MAQSAESLKRAVRDLEEACETGMNTGPRPTRPPPPEPPPVPPLYEPRLVREGLSPTPLWPPSASVIAEVQKRYEKKPKPRFRVVKRPSNITNDGAYWVVQRRVLWVFWVEQTLYYNDRAAAIRTMNALQTKHDRGREPPVIIYPDTSEARVETPMEGRLSLMDEDMAEVFDDEGVLR